MNLAAKILGGMLLLFSISMWFGHRQYVKREIRFQYATAYQMILVTFTSLGLLLGCHLWILPIAIVLWFSMNVFVINWIYSNRKLFDPGYILFFVILLFAADFCWKRNLSLLGWIVSLVVTAILYLISFNLAFPILERREWK